MISVDPVRVPEGDRGFQDLAGIDLQGLFHGILLILKCAEKSGDGRPRGFGRTAHCGLNAGLGRQLNFGRFREFQASFGFGPHGHGAAGVGVVKRRDLEAEPVSLGKKGGQAGFQVKIFCDQEGALGIGKTAAPVQNHGVDPVRGHGVGHGKGHLGPALGVGPQGRVKIGAGIEMFSDFSHQGLGPGFQAAAPGQRFIAGQGKGRLLHEHGAQLAGEHLQRPVEQHQGLRIRGLKRGQGQHPFVNHRHRHFGIYALTVFPLHEKFQIYLGPRLGLQLLEIWADLDLQPFCLLANRQIDRAEEKVRGVSVVAAGIGRKFSPGRQPEDRDVHIGRIFRFDGNFQELQAVRGRQDTMLQDAVLLQGEQIAGHRPSGTHHDPGLLTGFIRGPIRRDGQGAVRFLPVFVVLPVKITGHLVTCGGGEFWPLSLT